MIRKLPTTSARVLLPFKTVQQQSVYLNDSCLEGMLYCLETLETDGLKKNKKEKEKKNKTSRNRNKKKKKTKSFENNEADCHIRRG